MKTLQDRTRPGEFFRTVHHYTIEDHEDDKGLQHGAIVEFFESDRGPAMIVTPFTRGLHPNLAITQNTMEAFVHYSEGEIPLMSAFVNSEIHGRFAQNAVLDFLHSIIPSEWAQKHLPELFARSVAINRNWDGSKKS